MAASSPHWPAIGVAVFAVTGLGGYYLSRPSMETLYAGLDRQDVSSIGAALHDADIPFDATADGTSIMVRYGQTAQARMLLAEKGLPHSSNAGYELYDKMGSLGLTSFMQDVTRVRALEGELARTIQSMSGIKAARVHIVLPDEGSFRRAKQPPSASVVIRAGTSDDNHMAQAIRHLVAAAVPGMTVDEVTVLSTDGSLLASGDDTAAGAPGKMLDLEKMVDRNIQDNIRKTLTPTLGASNLQISVVGQAQHRHAADQRDGLQSRFARRALDPGRQGDPELAERLDPGADDSVARTCRKAKTAPSDGKQSTEENQKREELNNYEVSSKTHHDGQCRLWHRTAVGRGGDQSCRPAQRPRRQADRRHGRQEARRHRAADRLGGRLPEGARRHDQGHGGRLRRQRPRHRTASRAWTGRCRAAPVRHADQCA